MAARITRRDFLNGMAVGAGGACPARNVLFAGGYSGHGVPVALLARRLLRDLYAGEPLDLAYCNRFSELYR